jgi:hypothetical protein
VHTGFGGKTEERRTLGRHWLRREFNSKMDLQKVDVGRGHGLDRSGSG